MSIASSQDLAELRNYVQSLEQRVSNMDSNVGIRINAIEANITSLNTTMGAAQSVNVNSLQEIRDDSIKTLTKNQSEGDSTIADI